MDIRLKLIEKGYRNIAVQQQLSPAWTTDWMTEEGKQKITGFWHCTTQSQTTVLYIGHVSRRSCPVPAMQVASYRSYQPVLLHSLQGHVPLPHLQRGI
jgi:metal-sulfur cluster biosynthetic enzyme